MVRPHWLYILAVFFIPFTDTAVINMGSGGGVFSLQATMFLGALWIAGRTLRILSTRSFMVARQQSAVVFAVMIFCGVALASLVMPLVIDGVISVPAGRFIFEGVEDPLMFGKRHVTQWVYLLYGVILAIFMIPKNSSPDRLALSLKTYIWSGIFVSLWGLLQAALFRLNLPYPACIFNTATTEAAGGYAQVFGERVTRISSVAIEPSILAQSLVPMLPIVWFALVSGKPIISRRIDTFALTVIVICLLLSTSATAYVGILGAIVIAVVLLALSRRLRLRHLAGLAGFLGLTVIILAAIPSARAVAQEMLILKPQSWSAMERMVAAFLGWQYFLQYPILGIGWGVLPPSSIITYLLAHTGVLGLTAFAVAMFFVIRHLAGLMRLPASERDYRAMWGVGILGSLLVLLLVCLVSGFPFYFSHFWFILGIAMAAPAAIATSQATAASDAILQPETGEEGQ